MHGMRWTIFKEDNNIIFKEDDSIITIMIIITNIL